MVERILLQSKNKPKSKAMALAQAPLTLFGDPQLLEGEDPVAYDELLSRMRAAAKPLDVIDEMFTVDAVTSEWEVLRWRRLKFGLIRARGLYALEDFLRENLDYDCSRDYFMDDLVERLSQTLPAAAAQKLADEYAKNQPNAVEKVNEALADSDLGDIKECARHRKVQELVKEYARGKPGIITLIREFLANAATCMESLTADALVTDLENIERLDRLVAMAEDRRNAALREIERRRAILGATLRRTVEEIEDGEFEVIEATSKGRNAA